MSTADVVVDRIVSVVRGRLPHGVTPADLEGFLERHRNTLVGIVEQQLKRSTPDLWSPADRTRANLAAMRLLASKAPAEMAAQCWSIFSGGLLARGGDAGASGKVAKAPRRK